MGSEHSTMLDPLVSALEGREKVKGVTVAELDVFKAKSQEELCELYTHCDSVFAGPLLSQGTAGQLLGLAVEGSRKLACMLHYKGVYTAAELAKAGNVRVDMHQLLAVGALWSRRLSDAAKMGFLVGMFDFDKDGVLAYEEVVLLAANSLRSLVTLSSRVLIEAGVSSDEVRRLGEEVRASAGLSSLLRFLVCVFTVLSGYLSFDDLPRTASLSTLEVVRWSGAQVGLEKILKALPSTRSAAPPPPPPPPTAAATLGVGMDSPSWIQLDDPTFSGDSLEGPRPACTTHGPLEDCQFLNMYEVILAVNMLVLMKATSERTFDGSYRQVLLSEFRRLYERGRSTLLGDGSVRVEDAGMPLLHRELCNKVSRFKTWFMGIRGGVRGMGLVSLRTLLTVLCPCADERRVDAWIMGYLRQQRDAMVAKEQSVVGRLLALTPLRMQKDLLSHCSTNLGLLTLAEVLERKMTDIVSARRAIEQSVVEGMESPISKTIFLKHLCHPKFRRGGAVQWDQTLKELSTDGGTPVRKSSAVAEAGTSHELSIAPVEDAAYGSERQGSAGTMVESFSATINDVAEEFRKSRAQASEEDASKQPPTRRELTERLLEAVSQTREKFIARGVDANSTASDSSRSPSQTAESSDLSPQLTGGRERTEASSDRYTPDSTMEHISGSLDGEVLRSKLNVVTDRLGNLTGRWWTIRSDVENRMAELREIREQEICCKSMKRKAQAQLEALLDEMTRIEKESVNRVKELDLDIALESYSNAAVSKVSSCPSGGWVEEVERRSIYLLGPEQWLSKLQPTQRKLVRELASNLLGVFGNMTAAVDCIAAVRGRPDSITMTDLDTSLRTLKLGVLSRPALVAVFNALDYEKEGCLTAAALRRRLTIAAGRSSIACFAPPPSEKIISSLLRASSHAKSDSDIHKRRAVETSSLSELEHARKVLGLSAAETMTGQEKSSQSLSRHRKGRRGSVHGSDMFSTFLHAEERREHDEVLRRLYLDDSKVAFTKKHLKVESKRFRDIIKGSDQKELFDTGMLFNKHSLNRTTKYMTPTERRRRREAMDITEGFRRAHESKKLSEVVFPGGKKQDMIVLKKQHAELQKLLRMMPKS
ncbi:hypothetical protein FOZ61_001445 [Perkinsus olseni]|uniref:EF-hand domain-containing protein n=1 Tax=Perkinsus olseni TaxID=32597 RepID=A0A7J6LWU1_PEROL|nr:hypothetical protein FOZ61_001445 [Perkinsus olseni]